MRFGMSRQFNSTNGRVVTTYNPWVYADTPPDLRETMKRDPAGVALNFVIESQSSPWTALFGFMTYYQNFIESNRASFVSWAD